jgi:hypothetical protein
VDDRFEVSYLYFYESSSGNIFTMGEVKNIGSNPAVYRKMYVYMLDEAGNQYGNALSGEIEDVIPPGGASPFSLFRFPGPTLAQLSSFRVERDQKPGDDNVELPPLRFESLDGSNHVPDGGSMYKTHHVGDVVNDGDESLKISYKLAYYSPEDFVFSVDDPGAPFQPIPPGKSLPVLVYRRESIVSTVLSRASDLGIEDTDPMFFRVFPLVDIDAVISARVAPTPTGSVATAVDEAVATAEAELEAAADNVATAVATEATDR